MRYSAPKVRLRTIAALIRPTGMKQIVMASNPARADPSQSCLHELFEEQVARTPDAIAVRFRSEQLNYCELNERANQLARHLQDVGVRPGTLVGLCARRSLDAVVALHGILKAGGAYVPLDPDYPKERLAQILDDARVPVLLTQERLRSSLPNANSEAPRRVICLDRDWPVIARQPRDNLVCGAQPGDLVYVIYTSGSTGRPKGVLVEHRALVSHSVSFAEHFELDGADRVLQFAPLSFDVSAEEIFPTLLAGGTVVLRPDEWVPSLHRFHQFLAEERLTILNLPTPYWNQWMREMENHALELPASLRLVVVGSETVTTDQWVRWRKLAGRRVRWCNAYGITEATITSTVYEPESDEIPSSVPIGRPLANTLVYILDRDQQPTPVGVAGELHIGGEEIARGYLNQPLLAAQKFVPDSFSVQPGARMVRTGDLARLRPDGNLEFLGRIDHQVKVRGFRIELGEIESRLRQHELVHDAVVVTRPDETGEKRLIAYVVPRETTPHLVSALLNYLRQKLPGYMIPSSFVAVDALPLSPSGKVDRHALPAPTADRPELEQSFVAPADSLEEKLAALWREVLELEKVGMHDNFFDLGGHSLSAMRLCSEIENLTGRNLPLVTFFQFPTVRQLAANIRRTATLNARTVILTLQPNGSKPPLYLVHGAGGGMLWGYANLARHLDPDQPVYCFNSRGIDGFEEFSRIEDMAAHYVEALRALQPRGPYCLGGYCFGGEVAFEMAQQLQARGERVVSLVMFNAMPPNSDFERVRFTPAFAVKFLCNGFHWLRDFCHWTSKQRHEFVRRKVRTLRKQLARRFGLGTAHSNHSSAEDTIDLSLYPEHQRHLWDTHLRASAQYQPAPYSGHITVFRTRLYPFFCSFDPTFGWSQFAEDGVTVHVASGRHESILDEPQVTGLAKVLKNTLHAARAKTRETSLRLLNSLWLVLTGSAV